MRLGIGTPGPQGTVYRLELNNPPTSVGGIQEGATVDWCRLDINDPPAATGGIR